MAFDLKVTMWCFASERDRWVAAAKAEGRSLASFMRYYFNLRAIDHLGPDTESGTTEAAVNVEPDPQPRHEPVDSVDSFTDW